jgi:transposase InsO family protein
MKADRTEILSLVSQAQASGARQSLACEIIGISPKTLQRWNQPDNLQDGRLDAIHQPANTLTTQERQRILEVANAQEYAHLSPHQIVPLLADQGVYIASESSFYRVLTAENQLNHRHKAKPTRQIKKPRSITATAPNQLYSWDITYLPTRVRGIFLYLYLVMDVYSRKIVGWQIYEQESSALAADLMTDICQHEGIARDQVTLHSDNGSPMKGATLLATLQQLGVAPSFSRPSVSNDNPYSEALFRTLKYRPYYPEQPFADLPAARVWVQGFENWYNHEHLHSAINFVTPQQRHTGDHVAVLTQRKRIYLKAQSNHPNRWSGSIRNWEPITLVTLNPEKLLAKCEEEKAA